jgi:hypothetical protein
MIMSPPPLTSDERRNILTVLKEASRDLSSYRRALLEAAINNDKQCFESHEALALQWLEERVRPALARCSRIDAVSFDFLWRSLLGFEEPTDLLRALVKAFSSKEAGGQGEAFVDIFLYAYQRIHLIGRRLRPSERWAVYQVLQLASATFTDASVGAPRAWLWLSNALSIGAYDLVPRLLAPATVEAAGRDRVEMAFRLGETLASHLEGVLLFLGDHLPAYVHAILRHEFGYYRRRMRDGAAWFGWPAMIPPLRELRRIPKGDVLGGRNGVRWRKFCFTAVMYEHQFTHIYLPLQHLLPVLFYIDSASYQTRDIQRVMILSKRYIAYWRLRDVIPDVFLGSWRTANHYLAHRRPRGARRGPPFGKPSSGQEHSDQLVKIDLTRRAVGLWHRYHDRPDEMLRRCRALLARKRPARWIREFADLEEGRRVSAYLKLLPLWLLELRALRLFGRGSPQWDEANRLTRERLTCLVYPESIEGWHNTSAGLILLALEAIRQLAVARGTDPEPDSIWDREPLRVARALLVRLEEIPEDPRSHRPAAAVRLPPTHLHGSGRLPRRKACHGRRCLLLVRASAVTLAA